MEKLFRNDKKIGNKFNSIKNYTKKKKDSDGGGIECTSEWMSSDAIKLEWWGSVSNYLCA